MENDNTEKRLQKPEGIIDVVIDTDTYNAIDDQFALSYLMKSRDRFKLKAIYAAPFFNKKADSPEDGMEKSYREIMQLLELLEREEDKGIVYQGSRNFLPNETEAVISPAACNLVEQAMQRSKEDPLYVIAIAALTNIASALLMEPKIKDRMVIVWLGGNAYDWPNNREFNLFQDIAAARVLFGCGVPLVQIPCWGVVSDFQTTEQELTDRLKGHNKLCDYLVENAIAQTGHAMHNNGTRIIWDVTAIAWLLGDEFMQDRLEHSPIPEYDDRYSFDTGRHYIRYVYHINRDRLYEHLFETLIR